MKVNFTISNDGKLAREEIVRVSVPLGAGAVSEPAALCVRRGSRTLPAQGRVITRHPDGSIRRVMLSLPLKLRPGEIAKCTLGVAPESAATSPSILSRRNGAYTIRTDPYTIVWRAGALQIRTRRGRVLATLQAFGPQLKKPAAPAVEIIERGPLFAWLRWRQDGSDYSREVDLQVDRMGHIRLTQRILRHLRENDWSPDFGFELTAPGGQPICLPKAPVHFLTLPVNEPLGLHPDLLPSLELVDGTQLALANPLALRQHRGTLEATRASEGVLVRLSRLEPVEQEAENLLLQEGMWRVMEVVIQPGSPEQLADALDHPTTAAADWKAYEAVYHTGPPLRVKHPVLQRLVEKYLRAIHDLSMNGDDWGSLGGLERYNHCQFIWEDDFRTGDPRLRRVALDYSENYNNLSIYWGPQEKFYGGGRYPDMSAVYVRAAELNWTRPWTGGFNTRGNNAISFCTKGYQSFWLAYEESGDPRFRYAAEQQASWSSIHVHATVNYTRCIGQVSDFVKLYEYTGERSYLDNAVRLWTELQPCQEPDLLFTEPGTPLTAGDRYVPNDDFGREHTIMQAYVLQYASNALPYLLKYLPEDTRLRDTITACNDWLAETQTAVGAWSCPGATTAGLRWQTEYCHALMLGYEVKPEPEYLDALQRSLRAIAVLFEAYDAIPLAVTPWEYLAGMTPAELGKRYYYATDRDRNRDYTDGQLEFGNWPDHVVYLQVLLRSYLRHRPEASLFTSDDTLAKVLQMPTGLTGGRQ